MTSNTTASQDAIISKADDAANIINELLSIIEDLDHQLSKKIDEYDELREEFKDLSELNAQLESRIEDLKNE